MALRTFTLLRHGKVDGPPALYGHTDIALSAQGFLDAQNTLHKTHTQLTITAIIASPLIRCAEIAKTFAKEHNIPLHLEPQLQEMHFGLWDGIPFDEIGEAWPALEAFWNTPFLQHPPQGETLEHFATRVITVWNKLLEKNTGQHQLLVCHGGVIRIIIAHILQIDWRNASLFKQLQIDYASHTRIEIDNYEGALAVIKWIGAH